METPPPIPLPIPDLPKSRHKKSHKKKPPLPELAPLVIPQIEAPPESPVDKRAESRAEIDELRRIAHEIVLRKMQALRIYEPLPVQKEFHDCDAKVRLLRGSNRAGKTLVAAVECARIVLGKHPAFPAKDGRCYIVGKDEKHLGEVIYRKLFRAGAFKMIRDPKSGEWRAFRPWDPSDAERKKEAKPAPPLIPQREIVSTSWNKKVASIPEKVVLRNGWEIDFFSSLAKPPRGSDLDFVWLDEEIVDGDWVPEMLARLIDRQGRLIWGFTPQTGSDRAFELHQRCDEEMEDWRQSGFAHDKRPSNREFVILIRDNPHFTDKEKAEHASSFSPEEQLVRVEGEYAIEASKIYPEFSRTLHNVPYFDIPMDWTRYAVIDPGRQICAVLFAAVPPEDAEFPSGATDAKGDPVMVQCEGKEFVFLYDELYIPNCDAEQFGERMARKCLGQDFEAFIIDAHGSRSTEAGSGKTVEQQYRDQLQKQNVKSRATGHGFIPGSDDVLGRIEAFRGWLKLRPHGMPKVLLVEMRDKLPNFVYEIERWRYKKTRDGVTDQPESRGRVHLMACYDGQTEVLTERGWIDFTALPRDVRVLTVNLDTDCYEYQLPTDYIERRADKMVSIDGRRLNALVTEDHRMVVYERGEFIPSIKEAGDLHPSDRIKMSATWPSVYGNGPLVLRTTRRAEATTANTGDVAELMGWYAAEGCRDRKIQMPGRGYRVSIAQTKPAGRDRIRELTGLLPWKFHEDESGFYASSKQLWAMVAECGDLAENKMVPQWVKDGSSYIISRFIDGAVGGDGWMQAGTRYYKTTSKRLADDMQELFLKIGRTASISNIPAKPYKIRKHSGMSKPSFLVIEGTTSVAGLRNAANEPIFSTVPFDGLVYCVSVPNGTLVVRRNGKPMIAGNCTGYLAHHDPKYVAPKKASSRPSGAYAMFLDKLARKRRSSPQTITFGPSR